MYYFTRILILLIMIFPSGLLYEEKIELGIFCILVGLALILIELSDITAAIEKKD